jgi:hypothetical protein
VQFTDVVTEKPFNPGGVYARSLEAFLRHTAIGKTDQAVTT